LTAFLVVQWPFAVFLPSPAARNPLFGSHYFDYVTDPTKYSYQFDVLEKTARQFWTAMGFALLAAALSARLGLALATGLRRLQR
jgi:ABC-type Fe3+ transport system permease subunit